VEWSKIKNIVLLILAAVNLILLGLVFQRKQQVRQYEDALRSSTVAVLEDNHITVEEDRVPWEETYTSLTVKRSIQEEEALARKMLGDCTLVDTSPYTYSNDVGSVRFRSNGEYLIQYTDSPFGTGKEGEEERQTEQVLRLLSMDAEVLEVETDASGVTVVTVRQLWNNRPLFDCTSELEYQDGELRQISGKRMFGTPSGTGTETRSAAALLIDFMGELVIQGEVCNEIIAIETGYTMTTTLHEAAVLKPVWYLTTDTWVFELDALTGSCKRAG
jgi:hypothetical protein